MESSKAAEQEQREPSHSTLDLDARFAGRGQAALEVDEGGCILSVSSTISTVLGCAGRELIGRALHEVIGEELSGDRLGTPFSRTDPSDPFAVSADAAPAVHAAIGDDGLVRRVEVRRLSVDEADGRFFAIDLVARRASADGPLQRTRQLAAELAAAGATDEDGLVELADRIGRLIPGSVSCVTLADDDGERFLPPLGASLPGAWRRMMTGRRIAGSGLGAGAAMSSGRPVLAADITSDPLWGEVAESATEADLVASWSIPIIAGPGAAVHGAIEVLRQWASLPSVAELEALCVLGRLAGGALDGRFDNQAGHPSGQRSSVAGGGAFGRSPTGELQPQRRIFRGLALLDMVDLRLRMTSDEAERHALILMDLDQFGRHNEALGLERGNALLDETAERLAACLEPDDLFGQLAGDTFAVLKTSIDGPEDASDAALRMVLALERPFSLEGLPALIRGSVGVAIAEASDDESGLDLLVTATLALEEAKAAGSSVAMRTGGVGGRSDGVLGGAGLDLAYQPMVHAEDRGLVGVEALVRLSHPDTGPAQPQIVIDEADDRGLALPVGQWVMRTSGAQIATRFETDPPRVWVNLSRRLFEHPELLPALAEINGMQGVAPLGVEFSERLALADPERTDELIERLGVLGVSSGVDDFGRDRSTYVLGRFDVDLIKLAPELTDLAVGGARGGTSVARLVDTARLLGVRVCAKGIESEAAAEVMAELGCDWLQGFALGEPTSVEDLPASK